MKSFKNAQSEKLDRYNELYNDPFQTLERKASRMKLSPLIPSNSHKDYKNQKEYDMLSKSAEKNPKSTLEYQEHNKLTILRRESYAGRQSDKLYEMAKSVLPLKIINKNKI